MALNFQEASINLTKGLETRDDEFLAEGNDVMENVNLSLRGTPRKRTGQEKFETDLYGIDPEEKRFIETINTGRELVPRSKDLAVFSDDKNFVFSEALNAYNSNSFVNNIEEDQSYPLIQAKKIRTHKAKDMSFGSKFAFPSFVENSTHQLFFINNLTKTVEKATGSTIIDTTVGAGGSTTCVVNDVIYAVGYTSILNKLFLSKVNQDGFYESVADIETGLASSFALGNDCVTDGTYIYAVTWLPEASGNTYKIYKLDTSGNVLNTYVESTTTDSSNWNVPIQIAVGSGVVAVAITTYQDALTKSQIEINLLDDSLVFQTQKITGWGMFDATPRNALLFMEINDGVLAIGSSYNFVKTSLQSSEGVVSGDAYVSSQVVFLDVATSVFIDQELTSDFNILSKPLIEGRIAYFLCRWQTEGFVIWDDDGNFDTGTAVLNYGLVKVSIDDPTRTMVCSFFEKGATYDTPDNVFNDPNIAPPRFKFDAPILVKSSNSSVTEYVLTRSRKKYGSYSELFNTTFIPGSLPSIFDGEIVFPASFLCKPVITAVFASPETGTLPAGSYTYAAIFEGVDAQGNIYRSQVSNFDSITLGSPDAARVRLTTVGPSASRYMLSAKLKLYRRKDTEVTFKLVRESNLSANGIYLFDDSRVNIEQEEPLYSSGGIAEANDIPVLVDSTLHKNRLFGISLNNKIYFSNFLIRGEAPLLSEFFTINVDENQGRRSQDLTAIASLDNKLIIFKKNSILAIFGDGPDGTGANNDFTLPEIVTTDVGCNNPRSVVSTHTGLYFQSEKGIYLLSRNMEINYIGRNIDEFSNNEISSAILKEKSNRVIFTTFNNKALVHSYNREAWSTYTNHESEAAVLKEGKLVRLDSSGAIWKEKDAFDDNGDFIQQKMTSNWLKLSGVQGFQRIQRLMFLGRYKGDHTMKVRVYYDYEDYVWDEYTLTPTDLNYNKNVKPDVADYQDGINNGVFQWTVHLKKQKCQAIKIEILDEERGGSPTEAFSLTNITAKIGVKRGPFRGSEKKQV